MQEALLHTPFCSLYAAQYLRWEREKTFMLVLRRRVGEQIIVGGTITVTVERIRGMAVVLSISAPPSVAIVRAELLLSPADPEQAAREATRSGGEITETSPLKVCSSARRSQEENDC
jgi:carbon storage regulator CsrA